MSALDRRTALALTGLGLSAGLSAPAGAQAGGAKRLRVAADIAEVAFDPPRVSDRTSVTVNAHIFEPLLTYDPLAEPARLRPLTAAALPEVSDDHRRFVFTVRPGIFFSDDPAFGGRRRELVAADYVYSIKRYYDPRIPSEHLYLFENEGLLGLSELRQRAIAAKTGLDYDAPVPGLRVLDRYRFEVRLSRPSPRFVALFAASGLTGAMAREVVEAYGDQIGAHPVGTGPFVLKDWRRGSRILLARNPGFRDERYAATPPPDDPEAVALAARLQGRRLPMVDEVEVHIIQEEQPRWLAFVGGDIDAMELPQGVASLALPNGRLAPNLVARGVQVHRFLDASVRQTFFNCQDPDLGGLSPARVALRRAIALAYDNAAELRLVFRNQGLPAQSLMPPGVTGYDPTLKTEMGAGDLARAKALLDVHGYRDVDGDGWREHPDGRPLVLRMAGVQDARQRQINELWEKQMRAVGLRMRFEVGQFGELIKNSLAGRLQMWSFAWTTQFPDGDFFLALAYGPNSGQSNDARFQLPAFDRAYEAQRALPDGPERLAAIREAQRWMLAYMPYLAHSHALRVDISHAQVRGYRRHRFTRDLWRYTALD
ncbi:ABC transporter substrate-binding protein [Inhella crocodyli]|uniref:Bicyclomycin resistance protein n=1 Tax=Inhella crocodyli TaxID=2499851 RepID=A0A437LHT9_9BURK|nr:ABC transporter substrate-binding protein [Inhella crocodyli]RVT84931.1 bicyclomycin resistance protein [Inhella crocodyli]